MIDIGPEPQGVLLKRADVLAWLPGLTIEQWKKISPTLRKVYVPGGDHPAYDGQRPQYLKSEIKNKLVNLLREGTAA